MKNKNYYANVTRSMLAAVKEVGAMPFILFEYYLTWQTASEGIKPPLQRIADDLGLEKNAVCNLRKKLVEAGWVRVEDDEIFIVKSFTKNESNRSQKMNDNSQKMNESFTKNEQSFTKNESPFKGRVLKEKQQLELTKEAKVEEDTSVSPIHSGQEVLSNPVQTDQSFDDLQPDERLRFFPFLERQPLPLEKLNEICGLFSYIAEQQDRKTLQKEDEWIEIVRKLEMEGMSIHGMECLYRYGIEKKELKFVTPKQIDWLFPEYKKFISGAAQPKIQNTSY